ncbi:MAG: hypothetical protein JW795_04140 [Chitinivibrionales bacterium]|nr:hypothetical protein [Chitinivibrionales bacterium]
MAPDYLDQRGEFRSLSLKQLLEAREAFHVFLMRKKNVVGTAIGKHRVRDTQVPADAPKTLENTITEETAWPCILVFVKKWVSLDHFGADEAFSHDDYLPRSLYLPDGQQVPLCVLLVNWFHESESNPIIRQKFPGSIIGGGYPVLTTVQGVDHWATLGCLVTDGRTTFGLTNAHVTGRPGEKLYSMINGDLKEIGVSAEKQLKKHPFQEVYENLPGKHALVNLDIGLIEFSDVSMVTSQIFGLGDIRGIADVNHDTVSLRLIGCPIQAYGCSSGVMKGEIVGMFYRYTAIGGYEYVADYLIGPRQSRGRTHTLPFSPTFGDSGTAIVIDDETSDEHLKLIGILWGGQHQNNDAGRDNYYGMVTNIATVCRLLDVELVCRWNNGYDRYFGAYAHVTLPSLCVDVIKNKKLRKLLKNNVDRFSFSFTQTQCRESKGLSKKDFIPLSDVPDLVWKSRTNPYKRPKEGPNHFADMDQADSQGRTLLSLCTDHTNITPESWIEFYRTIKAAQMGSLPFRIGQIYLEMQRALVAGETAFFVAAAGIVTHYVFDACMPLHISYLHHGDPLGPRRSVMIGGKQKEISVAYDVHDEFDNQVIENHVDDLRVRLPPLIRAFDARNIPVAIGKIKSGHDAIVAVVELMRKTVEEYAAPVRIVADFQEMLDLPKRQRSDRLWEIYGEGMLKAIAAAVVLTARLWEAAWKTGNGKATIRNLDAVDEDVLKNIYNTKTGFLDSLTLMELQEILKKTQSRENAKKSTFLKRRRPQSTRLTIRRRHRIVS